MLHMLSIWDPSYRPRPKVKETLLTTADVASNRPCLADREMQVKNTLPKRSPVKRVREGNTGCLPDLGWGGDVLLSHCQISHGEKAAAV